MQDYGFENFRLAAEELYDEAYYVLLSKQRDYGPDNIRLSPFGEYQGLLTRIFDKVQRAVHLVSQESDGENESLRDTFLDLMNYGAIGVMLNDDTFPRSKKDQATEVQVVDAKSLLAKWSKPNGDEEYGFVQDEDGYMSWYK